MKKNWEGVKTVVLGLSLTGEAAARYLIKAGAFCTISDNRVAKSSDEKLIKELENLGIKVEMGQNKKETVLNADIIITSPGIPPHSDLIKMIKENNIELISEPELSYREADMPIITITGTNGKSTTTSLVSKIFQNAGYNAPACGNIGNPVINETAKNNDYLIAEISSFQLEYSPTFKPKIGAFLNYTPDHVDWHGNEEEYFKTKSAFLRGNRSPEWAVLNANDHKVASIANESTSKIYWFGQEKASHSCFISDNKFVIKENDKIIPVLNVNDINLIGDHNHQNIMASIAVARIENISIEKIAEAINVFESIEHRLEYVTEINGIKFYNDSKATNCDSTICALKAFNSQKIILIAGGRDKGTDLTELVSEINIHTTNVILIGEASERFANALNKGDYKNIYREESLESAVNKAFDLNAGPVVLSPACASYDMFKNFEERGRAFKDIVFKKKQQ